MVLPDLPTHAETQGDHIVLLTVPRATAFDVVKQGCLQGTTLQRSKVSTRLSRAGLSLGSESSPKSSQKHTSYMLRSGFNSRHHKKIISKKEVRKK